MKQITILGHVVSERGIEPDVAKTEAIKATPSPSNVSDFRSFLGTCGYVSKFIPSYANIVEPLKRLTRKGQKWTWEKEQAKAFKALKEALSDAPALACFSLNVPTNVITDASPVGLGAIFLQDPVTAERKPIAYISRSLTSTERKYSQIEREAPEGGEGGVLGLMFAGYVLLASQSPYPIIIVYFLANYRPHLGHFLENAIFAIPT